MTTATTTTTTSTVTAAPPPEAMFVNNGDNIVIFDDNDPATNGNWAAIELRPVPVVERVGLQTVATTPQQTRAGVLEEEERERTRARRIDRIRRVRRNNTVRVRRRPSQSRNPDNQQVGGDPPLPLWNNQQPPNNGRNINGNNSLQQERWCFAYFQLSCAYITTFIKLLLLPVVLTASMLGILLFLLFFCMPLFLFLLFLVCFYYSCSDDPIPPRVLFRAMVWNNNETAAANGNGNNNNNGGFNGVAGDFGWWEAGTGEEAVSNAQLYGALRQKQRELWVWTALLQRRLECIVLLDDDENADEKEPCCQAAYDCEQQQQRQSGDKNDGDNQHDDSSKTSDDADEKQNADQDEESFLRNLVSVRDNHRHHERVCLTTVETKPRRVLVFSQPLKIDPKTGAILDAAKRSAVGGRDATDHHNSNSSSSINSSRSNDTWDWSLNAPPRNLEEEHEPGGAAASLVIHTVLTRGLAAPVQDDGDNVPVIRPTATAVVDNNNSIIDDDDYSSSPYFEEARSEEQSLGGEEGLVSEGEENRQRRRRTNGTNGENNETNTMGGANQTGDYVPRETNDIARAITEYMHEQQVTGDEVLEQQQQALAIEEMSRESVFASAEDFYIEDLDDHIFRDSLDYACHAEQSCSSLSLYPNERGTMCDICLVEYKVGDVIAWSFNEKCDHAYHADCIKDWLMRPRTATCPSCRQEYVGNQVKFHDNLAFAAALSTPTWQTTTTTTAATTTEEQDTRGDGQARAETTTATISSIPSRDNSSRSTIAVTATEAIITAVSTVAAAEAAIITATAEFSSNLVGPSETGNTGGTAGLGNDENV